MSLTINTNIASLNAQRNLTTSQSALSTSLQRLSSGLRINSAKDDAAGLAIANRMTSQVNGLNQAARNANDGISLAQTAEGAMAEIGNNLQRLRELAVQSANATNSASDRASLDAESSQLIAEITRVSSQTSFNGINLLDGSFSAQAFQVGANANQTISINSIADSRSTALGSNILNGVGAVIGSGGVGATKAAAADLTGGNLVAIESNLSITTTNGGTTSAISYAALADAKAVAAAINSAASGVGVTATASNSATLSGVSVAGTITMTLNGSAISAAVSDPTDLTALMSAINGAQGSTGVVASFTSTSTKAGLTLSTTDGRDISVLDYANTGVGTASFSGVTLTSGAATDSTIKSGSVSLASSKGTITLAGANTDVFTSATQASAFSAVSGISLASAANAQLAIATVDAALSQINVSRGDLGAYQNRFSSAIANLQTTTENVTAARSRIQDADFAQETASMTRNSVLQQAGIAMLAQANALPNQVLTLLR
ncbi:MAG: flagellin [Hydrogenophilales bacterium CG_4_9_14_3_um_filter_59_35]|nr:MAG: flagellin [Hydrogenophilales bacterium CG18_big_fil_WC_8_21_14_2_50_58_12]PIY01981.1 MAG: flagellin [Hydrogenophilales bacterium CG_4_10_14_3_um_filter_58_23]PJB06593.1 MAG: flagellin [Hydrogenophilales bacterium CG_4_9_14_3_um_filter_59_35]